MALNLRGLLGRALVQQEAPAPPPTTAPHADRERVQSLSYAQVAESLAAKPAGPTIHAAGPGPQHQPHASPMHVYEWGGGNVHGTVAPTALSGLVAAPGAQVKMVEAMTRCVIRGDSPLAKLRRCAVQVCLSFQSLHAAMHACVCAIVDSPLQCQRMLRCWLLNTVAVKFMGASSRPVSLL